MITSPENRAPHNYGSEYLDKVDAGQKETQHDVHEMDIHGLPHAIDDRVVLALDSEQKVRMLSYLVPPYNSQSIGKILGSNPSRMGTAEGNIRSTLRKKLGIKIRDRELLVLALHRQGFLNCKTNDCPLDYISEGFRNLLALGNLPLEVVPALMMVLEGYTYTEIDEELDLAPSSTNKIMVKHVYQLIDLVSRVENKNLVQGRYPRMRLQHESLAFALDTLINPELRRLAHEARIIQFYFKTLSEEERRLAILLNFGITAALIAVKSDLEAARMRVKVALLKEKIINQLPFLEKDPIRGLGLIVRKWSMADD